MAMEHFQQEQDDSFVQLCQAHFDPVQFLNESLPSLAFASQGASSKQSRTATLQSASTNVQNFLSKLNTHSIRSSSELTTLTDEILRSGNRLAYKVEVLRGDVNSLYELLTESLKDDISLFLANEVAKGHAAPEDDQARAENIARIGDEPHTFANDPDFIRQLRLLGTVKSRLEAVVHAFGEALKWPVAPSEVSVASSLISVSAPELGVANTAEDDQAREYARKLRIEVIEALDIDGGSAVGLEAASKKVNNIRSLSQIWRGTAEEKARTRTVDGLVKLVDERKRTLEARSAPPRSDAEGATTRSSSMPGRAGRIVEGSTNTAAGLFRNLQKLRDEIYQD